ncbi:MAG: hypothetical protein JEY96_14915 [Bacteroidales bacterium]|nr:hypothetical protein [Bacteroidales bacterium]
MKNLKFVILILIIASANSLIAQNLRTIETYYDPYSHTQIKERYTVETQQMQKHGLYQSWDKFGTIYEEINYKQGKKDGLAKQYFTHNYVKTILWESSSFIGKVEEETTFKNDQFQGIRKMYSINNGQYFLQLEQVYESGELTSEMEYYAPNKIKHKINNDGLCERWYENGRKEVEYNLKDGLEQGKATSWYKNGQIDVTGTYKNGVCVGDWTANYPDGNLERKETYWNETGLIIEKKEYASNNKLAAEMKSTGDGLILFTLYDTMTNTPISKENMKYKITPDETLLIMQGESSYYHKGQEISKGVYKNDKRVGLWKIYYDRDVKEDEKTKEVFNLEDAKFYREIEFDQLGNPIGKVTDYYISGQKQFEGTLLSMNPDVYDGECNYYYSEGGIQSKLYYKNRNRTGKWEFFHANGRLEKAVYLVNDKPDGKYQEWWNDGTLKEEGAYKNGMFVGEWKGYNQDGSLNTITSYDNNGDMIGSTTPKDVYYNIKSNNQYNLDQMLNEIEQRYTMGSVTFQKNTVHKSFVKAHNYLSSQIDGTNNYEIKLNNYEKLFNLSKKVAELSDEEIKEMSKSLKKIDSLDTILNIFGID